MIWIRCLHLAMLIATVVYVYFLVQMNNTMEWLHQLPSAVTCANQDVYGFLPVLAKTELAPSRPSGGPKVLCFVNTHEQYHATRVQAVLDTWGPSCDKLVFASSKTDPQLGAVQINNTSYEYQDLWNKHRETLRYIYETYRDEYEWFFKADDDTYVVLENLKEFLGSPEIRDQHEDGVPLHIGNANDYKVDTVHGVHDASRNFNDQELLTKFLELTNNRYAFNVGGAGYAINLAFLERFMEWIERRECSFNRTMSTQLDDGMLSFCSAHFGVFPYPNTRDSLGRERFHQFNPHELFTLGPNSTFYKDFSALKRMRGGFHIGEDCCSNKSITFHRLKPNAMRSAHYLLRMCRATRLS